jgi:hypothetical protein
MTATIDERRNRKGWIDRRQQAQCDPQGDGESALAATRAGVAESQQQIETDLAGLWTLPREDRGRCYSLTDGHIDTMNVTDEVCPPFVVWRVGEPRAHR